MANILDVVRALSQAASNAYDGYEHMDEKIGLRREEGAHNVVTLNFAEKIDGQTLRLDDFFSRCENRQTIAFGALMLRSIFTSPIHNVGYY